MTIIEPSDERPLRIEVRDRIAVITMHRPGVRNAIDPAMRVSLYESIGELDRDPTVDAMVLTGADPAFCAGLDLTQLGDAPSTMLAESPRASRSPFPERTTPLIGAVNGPAVTGGLELALNCDFLIASAKAAFADTHARVGVMPGWGLTALLADAVGRRRAREMSLTGNFVGADQAMAWGLVNHVVAHADLLSVARSIAADIVGNDQVGVRRMLATYAEQEADALGSHWDIESDAAASFATTTTPGAQVAERRAAIIERGRQQQ